MSAIHARILLVVRVFCGAERQPGNGRFRQAFLWGLPLLAVLLMPLHGVAQGAPSIQGQTRTQLPDGRLLLLGGKSASSLARVFDPLTGQTVTLPSGLSYGRHHHGATVLPDGNVLITGGVDATGNVLTEAERFDPRTGVFSTPGNLGLLPRSEHAIRALADGRLIVLGGRGPRGEVRSETEILDLKSLRIEAIAALPAMDRRHPQVVQLTDGDLLIRGGETGGGQPQKEMLRYRWTERQYLAVTAQSLATLPWPESAEHPSRNTGAYPVPDSTDADPEGIVVLRLSQPLDPRTVHPGSVALIGPRGATSASVTPSEDGLFVFVSPQVPLLPGTRYTLVARELRTATAGVVPLTSVAFQTRDAGSAQAGQNSRATSSADGASRSGQVTGAHPSGVLAAGLDGGPENPLQVEVPASLEGDDEIFAPTARHRVGRWFSGRPLPEGIAKRINDAVTLKGGLAYENLQKGFRSALRLRLQRTSGDARADTGLSGQVLRLNDLPLVNATVSVAGRSTRTDLQGAFQFTGLAPGRHEVFVDGRSAVHGDDSYGRFVVGATVEANEMTQVPPVYVPKIRATDWISLPSPTRRDMVVRHPNVPGMEIHIPKGTVLRERDGALVTRLALMPMPLDRAPVPFPDNAPTFVSVQPGGLTVHGLDPLKTRGIRVIYPNATNAPAGSRWRFWKYDPAEKGWYVYGDGAVSADALQVLPDAGVELYDTIGFMAVPANSPDGPGKAPPHCGDGGNPPDDPCSVPKESKSGGSGAKGQGTCPAAADPVDCATGLFVLTRTDLTVTDIAPLYISRTYRPNDSVSRSFGFGFNHSFGAYLHFDINSANGMNDTYVEMMLANGLKERFNRTNLGQSPPTFEYAGLSPQLKKAIIIASGPVSSPYRWTMRRRDGTKLEFASDVSGYPLMSMVDTNDNRVQFVYVSGNLTRLVSSSGRTIDLTYDAQQRITQAVDHTGRTVSYHYYASPANPNCPTNSSPPGYLCKAVDPLNYSETYAYDSLGRMTSIVDKRGNTLLTNTYDAQGKVATQTDAVSGLTTFSYTVDGNGRITQTDVTDPRTYVTRMSFNSDSLLLSRTEALGTGRARTTSYEYHPTSKLLSAVVDALGRRTEYTYDGHGNRTQSKYLAGTGSQYVETFQYTTWDYHKLWKYTDPRGKITTYSYDQRGRLYQIADPLNNLTKFSYSGTGLVTQIIDPRNQITQFAYSLTDLSSVTDPLSRVTSFFTDPLGRVVQSTNALGHKTSAIYDKLHRVTSSTDGAGNTVGFSYDGNGNLQTFTDARSNATAFSYDAKNRLTSRTDALTRFDTFTYDGNDNVLTSTDRKLQVTTHDYDELNRRTLTTWQGGATTAFTYDAGDRLTQVTDSVSGTITRSYDDRFDALATETVPLGAGTSTTTSTYDVAGRRTQMQVTGQTAVTYGYDDANRMTTITQGANAVGFTYDIASRRTQATLPNGVTIDYGYDNANQLTSLVYKRNGVTIGDLTYSYDSAGRRKTMGGTLARVNLPPALTSASYDSNNRLTNWSGTAFSYDHNGNLTSDGTRTYTWDTRDRLTALNGGGFTTSYGYDAFARRTTKTINGVQSGTLYDGFSEVHTTTGSTLTSTLLNGPGLDERYARTQSGSTYVFLPDALGSTLNLVSPGGSLTAAYTYEPYGATTQSGMDDTQYRYTGREDDGTGLMYYRARYYHPRISRFISEDPIGLAGGYNLYGYVEGNPASFRDALGLKIWFDGSRSWTDVPSGPNWAEWEGWHGGKAESKRSHPTIPRAVCEPSPRPPWPDGPSALGGASAPTIVAGNTGAPGNNQAQNKQARDVARQLQLSPAQRQQLHREISGQNYGYHQILEVAREIKAGGL